MTAKKEAVQAYIDRVLAPKIQGDGGWVEFVSLEGDRLTLRFQVPDPSPVRGMD
mgnify:CR=1 FL=1